MDSLDYGLETKFAQAEEGLSLVDGSVIEGYASLFDTSDRGGDIVCKGAYTALASGACKSRASDQDAVAARSGATHRRVGRHP